jgi:UDP-N-acetylmuramoylalanine-D-glutamate ligase
VLNWLLNCDKNGGAFRLSAILKATCCLVKNPGIAQNEAIVVLARANNIPVISDIELFSRHANAPIIGITGEYSNYHGR